jgi:putative peptide zinc metalloprotease protein
MTSHLANSHWHRVAQLKPKVHSHIQIHRHDYRGLVWYIIEDASSGRNHRFNPAAYHFIGLLDGKLTVQEIFVALTKQLGDNAPSQEEIIQLLGQLHSADLIRTNQQFDTEDLFERKAKINFGKLQQRLANPVSQKLPLWDPDNFLNQHLNKVSWLLNTKMALLWLVIITAALLMAAQNWPKISHHFDVIAFAPYNFLILFLLYPLIKVLHELAHAFVTKIKGGEVHEIGINFLLFLPVPYVNVSSASHFRDKYDRILVSAAGIMVESFLAALGLFVFLNSEPGLVQNISFNILLTGGVSSLFFNGNPLLKYDGYYVLADALEIPNLYQRAVHYWRYLFKRYLFGLKNLDTPATATGEPFWFMVWPRFYTA